MKVKFYHVVMGSILLGTCYGQVFADVVGKVISAQGEVMASGVVLKRGSSISGGQVVKTGANASTQLRLTDGTLVSLREKSEYRVDNISKANGEGKESSTLLKGGLRSLTPQDGKPRDHELKTSVAVIGIRGTLLNVYLPSKNTIYAGCFQGQCEVKGREFGGIGQEQFYTQTAHQAPKFSNNPPPGLMVGPQAISNGSNSQSDQVSYTTSRTGASNQSAIDNTTSVFDSAQLATAQPNKLQVARSNSLQTALTGTTTPSPNMMSFVKGTSPLSDNSSGLGDIGTLSSTASVNNPTSFSTEGIPATYYGTPSSSQEIYLNGQGTGLYWGQWTGATCSGLSCSTNNGGSISQGMWITGLSTPTLPTQGQFTFNSFVQSPQGNSTDGPITGGSVNMNVNFGTGEMQGSLTLNASQAQWTSNLSGTIVPGIYGVTLTVNSGSYTPAGGPSQALDLTQSIIRGFFSGNQAQWFANSFYFANNSSTSFISGISVFKR